MSNKGPGQFQVSFGDDEKNVFWDPDNIGAVSSSESTEGLVTEADVAEHDEDGSVEIMVNNDPNALVIAGVTRSRTRSGLGRIEKIRRNMPIDIKRPSRPPEPDGDETELGTE